MLELSCTKPPRKVALEADEGTIHRVWLETKRLLQIRTVVRHRWCGDRFGLKNRFFLTFLPLHRLIPGSKVVQVAQIVPDSGSGQVLCCAQLLLILTEYLLSKG